MANGVTSWFNNWFGSNITYIANAYSKADHVWALFSYKELSVDEIKASISGLSLSQLNANVNFKSQGVNEGLRIPFNDVHKKRRDTYCEYVTILAKEPNGSVTTICENLKVLANRSIIVTNKGSVQEQMYGGNLWVDFKGTNHKP